MNIIGESPNNISTVLKYIHLPTLVTDRLSHQLCTVKNNNGELERVRPCEGGNSTNDLKGRFTVGPSRPLSSRVPVDSLSSLNLNPSDLDCGNKNW